MSLGPNVRADGESNVREAGSLNPATTGGQFVACEISKNFIKIFIKIFTEERAGLAATIPIRHVGHVAPI